MSFLEEQAKREFKRGEVIFKDGDPGPSMYIIIEGKVEIFKNIGDHKTVLAVLEKGMMMGEMGVIDSRPRSASAVAITDVTVMQISREMFKQRLEGVPKWMQTFFSIMGERLRVANLHQNLLMSEGCGRQVIFILAALAQQVEPDSTEKRVLKWKNVSQTISFVLALEESLVQKVLNQLAILKVIKLETREGIGKCCVVEFNDKLQYLAQYCSENYLRESGIVKELSPEFMELERTEIELLQTIFKILREQHGMDDFPVSMLADRLKTEFKNDLGHYREYIEKFISKGLMEDFAPDSADKSYRITDSEKFNEKIAAVQKLKEMKSIVKQLVQVSKA